MKLSQVLEAVGAEVLVEAPGYAEAVAEGVIVSDLMSDVLLVDHENQVLISSLATEQAVRTAHLIDASALIVANGKMVSDAMTALAKSTGLTLASMRKPKFEISLAIARAMNL